MPNQMERFGDAIKLYCLIQTTRRPSDFGYIPFTFKNARFERVYFGEGLGVELQEESSLSRFYNDALCEKMDAENGYSWAQEV